MQRNSRLWLIIGLVLFPFGPKPLFAQQYSQRLINNWQFLKEDLGGIWEAVRDEPGHAISSVPLWKDVQLPHCYNVRDAVDPNENYYGGPAWHRTLPHVDNPFATGRTLLHFEGAGQKTEACIYTTKVGEHVGGHGKKGTADIQVKFRNLGQITHAKASWKIVDPSGRQVADRRKDISVSDDALGLGNFSVKKPALWSPNDPNLYSCQVKLSSEAGDQEMTVKFGFRHFQFLEHRPFMLNGQRLLIRGTHRHEDQAGVGATMTEPMIHIYGHTWPVRWGKPDDQHLLKVYSNCKEVELFLNGKSLGKKQRDSQDYPAAELRRRPVLKEGKNTVKAVGFSGKEKLEDEISFDCKTQTCEVPDQLGIQRVNSQNDPASVWVQAFDKNGTLCLDTKNFIEYSLSGRGHLIDDLGTSAGSRKVQLFNGAGMIRVKLDGSANWIAVNAEGLKPAFARLKPNGPAVSAGLKPIYFRQADLDAIKQRIKNHDAGLMPAFHALLADADSALDHGLYSVTQKTSLPASGDIHDYYSVGPYWWPDSSKADGLPYIRHDGQVNPERYSHATDGAAMKDMRDDVVNLSLAYFFTNDEKYAAKASDLLRTWFLSPKTRMNPNMDYAQAIPGRTTGRDIGIIDGAGIIGMLDFIRFLQPSQHWTADDETGLKQWFSDFLDWLRFSDNGRGEREKLNNHGTWYDAQTAAYALFTGQEDVTRKIMEKSKEKRIAAQIAPDGSQPKELARTKSLSYSTMNLRAFVTLARLGEQCGVDLWDYEAADGASIKKAADFLLPYLDVNKKWPYEQIAEEHRADLVPIMLQVARHFHEDKYKTYLKKFPFRQYPKERFWILNDFMDR